MAKEQARTVGGPCSDMQAAYIISYIATHPTPKKMDRWNRTGAYQCSSPTSSQVARDASRGNPTGRRNATPGVMQRLFVWTGVSESTGR